MTHRLFGWALALGAACIWLAWWLMPDAATSDAAQILAAVAPARASVQLSALVQLAGAALIVPGLAAEAAPGRPARAGALVMLCGALGMAADAVYHQLAYEMSAPGIAADRMLPVMAKMQTVQLRALIPLLLAFIAGAPLLGWQLARRAAAGAWIHRLLIAPLVTIPVGVLAVQLAAAPRRVVALAVLAEICAGLAMRGLAKPR